MPKTILFFFAIVCISAKPSLAKILPKLDDGNSDVTVPNGSDPIHNPRLPLARMLPKLDDGNSDVTVPNGSDPIHNPKLPLAKVHAKKGISLHYANHAHDSNRHHVKTHAAKVSHADDYGRRQ
ncbi:uncharacterized protein LOC108737412 [Agrilus planipennis]|uniref:Uncharacterized protein LOC108737412 n=1 Tax=Agrilus planipennis TaxID=224129 RepID=A0A1W4X011_AGRPL|nr:uncharacterized protein LOC108737412 [Agrilus planipennis]